MPPLRKRRATPVFLLTSTTTSTPLVGYIFTVALVLQSLHLVEHIAQVYQHAVLGLSVPESHGILFFLDLEWNHWLFNTFYFALLAIIFVGLYRTVDPTCRKPAAFVLFSVGFFLQGYHVIEHTVRMIQYFQTGCDPCKGIMGWYFDGVYLHAAFNTIAFIGPLAAFLLYGFHAEVIRHLRVLVGGS